MDQLFLLYISVLIFIFLLYNHIKNIHYTLIKEFPKNKDLNQKEIFKKYYNLFKK